VNAHDLSRFSLEEGRAFAFVAPLRTGLATIRRMHTLLSPAERARAGRFVFERDRRTFILSHGALRQILGWFTGQDPASLRFREGPRGKPYLIDGAAGLDFNLSHCDGACLVGVTRGAQIGVDVERLREVDDMQQLARQCFSASERRELDALPVPLRYEGFFNGWTRKEAFIKAIGDGLSYPLDRFDVSLAPGTAPRVRAVGGSTAEASRWTLAARRPAPDVIAAVAVAAPDYTIHWEAPESDWYATEMEDVHGRRGTRGHHDLPRGGEPRRTVFNLAGRS